MKAMRIISILLVFFLSLTPLMADATDDIISLYESLENQHPDFNNRLSKAASDALFARECDAASAGLSRPQLFFSLQRIAAIAHDSHTVPILDGDTTQELTYIPLGFDFINDDLVIVTAPQDEVRLLGKTVSSIEDHDIEALIGLSDEQIPNDNATYLMTQVASWLSVYDFLAAIGVADGPVDLVFDDGTASSMEALTYTAYASTSYAYLRQALPPTMNPGSLYSAMSLGDPEALLINYHACAEMPGYPFGIFADDVCTLIREDGYKKVIIDLRWNSGGDSRIIAPLIDGLEAIQDECGLEVYVLIAENTFSSAILNALELKDRLDATLVGRPTGGSVSHYGEIQVAVLPWSGIQCSYSTKYFDNGATGPLLPDIHVAESVEAYRDGVDVDLMALGVI